MALCVRVCFVVALLALALGGPVAFEAGTTARAKPAASYDEFAARGGQTVHSHDRECDGTQDCPRCITLNPSGKYAVVEARPAIGLARDSGSASPFVTRMAALSADRPPIRGPPALGLAG